MPERLNYRMLQSNFVCMDATDFLWCVSNECKRKCVKTTTTADLRIKKQCGLDGHKAADSLGGVLNVGAWKERKTS